MLEITQDECESNLQISYWEPSLSEEMVFRLANDFTDVMTRVTNDIEQTMGKLMAGNRPCYIERYVKWI